MLPTRDEPWLAEPGAVLRLTWPEAVEIDGVVLAEDIAHGQRIDEVVIDAVVDGGSRVELARAASIGYRRILDLPVVSVLALEVRVVSARGPVRVSSVGALAPSVARGPEAARGER